MKLHANKSLLLNATLYKHQKSNCKALPEQSWFGNHLIRLLDSGLLIAVGLSDIYGIRAAVFPYITHYHSDLVSGHLFFKTFIF